MSKQKFKVGDTVRIVEVNIPDAIGTIVELREIDNDDIPYYVNGLWCRKVELVKREKHPVIVITTDGKTTTATMREGKKIVKTATATCSDKDTFDYDEGARIAFERLQGRDPFPKEQKPAYYNGKVVCVKSGFQWWTVGKIYDVRNGRIKANDGDVFPRPAQEPYKDAEDIHFAGCDMSSGDGRHNRLNEFIPLVED